ncbi:MULTISPECIES: macrolide 2'-phosphotransferase [Micrococcaceae]|uniref:Macrolide phosphotransferase n=1 Tax=Pseudarthrobacter siccitolerans TaxID=861266 RepID=A0ABU0PHT1_9MICC|nr:MULTISPECIES: macrolide 2'-phosphotransferase [Micrococcaceae]MDQ0673523.1 macrolide phosphotransferase [Pseudarthrobacter siccitolerans]MDQ0690316.1 macrolide phosphotransferase [Arthrobacter sp. W4I7]
MRRKPIELAAVATAAVPGLTPTAVSSAPDDPADFDSALLLDSEGKRWRVRSPRHAEASARLETEFLVLRAFAPAIRAELPFLMPTVAGSVRLGTLSTFVYSHLAGSTRSVEELTAGPDVLAREIGVALAAIHDLPRSLVSNADLPSYTPNEFRQRRLNELDQAATTGKIPPALLLRWEHALEDVSLWRFNPSVVHGDLHEDNLLVEGQRVTAVTGWTDLRIGDPADDFAWLVASNEQDFVDAVLDAYTASRRDTPDNHLLRRAALSAEFALAQYLVKGIASEDSGMIAEAEEMLATLDRDVKEYGGQPISVEPQPATVAGDPGNVPVVRAADAGATPSVASVTVVPVPVPAPVQPAVLVTPIPAEPAAGPGTDGSIGDGEAATGSSHDQGQSNPGTGAGEFGGPDDTSTAAISIIDPAKSQASS